MSDSIWRTQLGWLSFLLAKAFAGALVLTLIGATWLGVESRNGAIGFFGFGIPMIVADLGTAALWSGEKSLQKTLGWSSTVTGLVCGVALFILVGTWVLADNQSTPPGNLGHFLGFGTAMLVCGGFGISMLYEAEGKRL
jgi:hypothetical protein